MSGFPSRGRRFALVYTMAREGRRYAVYDLQSRELFWSNGGRARMPSSSQIESWHSARRSYSRADHALDAAQRADEREAARWVKGLIEKDTKK